jgi:metal-responsive CopG/Arc/MetJ family transcriptional regulator
MKEGRKMKAKVAITIESEVLEKIDKMAEELELSRSHFIENLLSVGLADAQALKVVGLLDLAKVVRRVKDGFDERVSRLKKGSKEVRV